MSFGDVRRFDQVDRDHIGAYADLCAQALARVALTGIRERLLADLEGERARLEAVLQQAPEGLMIAESPSGRILLANDQLETILGFPRSELHQIAGGEKYRGFDEDGNELRPEDWPLARAVRGETVPYQEIELVRADGSRAWVAKRAGPVLGRDGSVVAGVATIIDISAQRLARENRLLLATVSEILASSLDYEETIRRVAEAVVPGAADWITVDVLDDKGVPRRVAVAHDGSREGRLRDVACRALPARSGLRRAGPRSCFGPAGPTWSTKSPTRCSTGWPATRSTRRSSERWAFGPGCACPSLPVTTFSVPSRSSAAESGRRFGPEDLGFAENLAARVALAIANSRSYPRGGTVQEASSMPRSMR